MAFDVNADNQTISSSARIKSLIHPEMKFNRSDFGFAFNDLWRFIIHIVITTAKLHKMIMFIYIDKTLHFVYNYKHYKR